MKKVHIFSISILLFSTAFSQKNDYIWLDGDYAPGIDSFVNFYIDFKSLPPVIDTIDSRILFSRTNTAVSNVNGKLAFYSNGCFIRNAQHSIMSGGEEINAGFIHDLSCSIGDGYVIFHGIFGIPLDDTLYNLFHHRVSKWDGVCSQKELLTTQINMNANQGLGTVVYKDSLLIKSECLQLACANQHANGRDWWVLAPDHHEDRFFRFLISASGIQGPWVQDFENPTRDSFDTCGWSEFSPDGGYFMINACHRGIAVYDFDRCSGLLSNTRYIPGQPFEIYPNWGAVFSPNSRYLYAVADNASRMLQYDMDAPNLADSELTVAVWDSFYHQWPGGGPKFPSLFLYLQRGPDGKLYNWTLEAPYLHVIDFPDRRGPACAMHQRAIRLPNYPASANSYYPNYRLGPIDGSPCDSLGIDNRPVALFRYDIEDTLAPLQVTFTDLSYYEPNTWSWDFGDGATSQDTSPVHTFTASGIYKVCLTVGNANASHTFCRDVPVGTIAAPALPVLPRLLVYPNPCADYLTVQQPALLQYVPRFTLTDAFGRQVLQCNLSDFIQQIDIRHLPSGVYFWQYWFGARSVQSGKIAKQ